MKERINKTIGKVYVVYRKYSNATPQIAFCVHERIFSNRKAAIEYIIRVESANGSHVFKNSDERLIYTYGINEMPLYTK